MFTMPALSAEQIANQLKQRKNLLRVEHGGSTMIWFSTEIPDGLPIGNKAGVAVTQNVILPHGRYLNATNTLTGWMIFWKHIGGKCSGAGAFISISPLNSGNPVAVIEMAEPVNNNLGDTGSLWTYGFLSRDYFGFISKGLVNGLLAPCIFHPLADIKISIHNVLSHQVDTSANSFEVLGNGLMAAMIFEMYKRDWIKGSKG